MVGNWWNRARFIPQKYEEAQQQLLDLLSGSMVTGMRGYVRDTVYAKDENKLIVSLQIDEGHPYYHRNISWTGNQSYHAKQLGKLLGINRGDIYCKSRLDQRLYADPQGTDISSLYQDNGHLFFRIEAVESAIDWRLCRSGNTDS